MKIRIDPNYNLGRLQSWLSFELAGPVLLYLSYIYIITLPLAILAALALLPLLFKVLIGEKKYGWIKFFFLCVVGSGLVSYAFFSKADWMLHSSIVSSSLLVSLMFFYFYCGFLKLAIPRWFHEDEEVYS
ncbi:MAG: hypothetical protein EA391_00990 [Balneolaceae bacterium]|nr:MAG: hypothetical protein EA391_00990 [Balneolaceae bacterium]